MLRLITLVVLSCSLTSCALTRDYVAIQYKPTSCPQRIMGAESVGVAVTVNDTRGKENVGCKINGYGIEMANIMPTHDIAETFKNAVSWELQQRGFVMASRGNDLNIQLCKFFNDYKPGFFSATAGSETVLNVTLKKKNGVIAYSKTILGFGAEETCFLASGSNATLALERSLYQAVQKLMNDPDFIFALMN